MPDPTEPRETAQQQRRREIAALLIALHDATGARRLRRADVRDRWAAAYPEQAVPRAGSDHGPGTRAAATVRRGLAEWEQTGALRRDGEHVLLVDLDALRAAADE